MNGYEEERERLKKMTLAEAENELSNRIYEAAAIVERLEHVRSVRGNGHHARQKIAEMACQALRDRWGGPR